MAIFIVENVNFKDIIYYKDITISEKGTTFITGESGSGKSSLLRLLNSTESPNSGKIYYKNTDINTLDKLKFRQEIILVSQRLFLFNGSIKDNFIKYYSYFDNKVLENDNKLLEYLKICQIDFDLDKEVNNLSGGEKQRIFNAIALSFNPRVLMFDEPTSALDYETSVNFFNDLKDYTNKNNIKLISISHDKNLVDKFADEIINLKKSDNYE